MNKRPRLSDIPDPADQSLPPSSSAEPPAGVIPPAFRAARGSRASRPARDTRRADDELLDQVLPPHFVALKRQVDATRRAGLNELPDDELGHVIAATRLLSYWISGFETACLSELHRRVICGLAAGIPLDAEIAALLTG